MKLHFFVLVFLSTLVLNLADMTPFRQTCPPGPDYPTWCPEYTNGCLNSYYEDTCEDPNQICCPDNCTFVCKDALYEKAHCPYVGEDGSEFAINYAQTYKVCLDHSNCPDDLLCCRGFCDFPMVCQEPSYRIAECPEFGSFLLGNENYPKATRCTTHADCVGEEKLCCFDDQDEAPEYYCTTPIYVTPGEVCDYDYPYNRCWSWDGSEDCPIGTRCFDTGCGKMCLPMK